MNEDKINNINKKYLNSLLLFFILLSIGTPSLIHIMTGVNIYDHCSINESIYSKSFVNIRISCATVFWSSITYLWLLNIDRLKLKRSIFNEPIMWAPIFVKGGFEKFVDPELIDENVTTKQNDEHVTTKQNDEHVTNKPSYMFIKNKWTELNENDISASAKLSADNNKTLNTKSSSEPDGVPIPYPPGSKNTRYSRPYWGPYGETVILPLSDSPDENSLEEGNNKVRFKNKEVKEIRNSVSADAKIEWHKEYKKLLYKNIKERDIEMDKNISNNSDSTYSNYFDALKGKTRKLTVL
jgi:hypothetical protein